MKFFILSALALCVSAAPTVRQAEGPYTITSPAQDATIYSGKPATVQWIQGDNKPLTISLAGSDSTDTVSLAENVNGNVGEFVVNVPSVASSCKKYRLVLGNEGINATYSQPFYVSADGKPCDQQQSSPASSSSSAPPTSSASMEKDLSGATAVASISILNDNGQPMHTGDSAAGALTTNAKQVTLLASVVGAAIYFF
ncbi:hypothetical protein BCR43DRAFT_510054 [Syncephalastrum racemosum]|uniref:Yeast cell wall synthesis Kre9/Knh1-like N-terminal domain-containing protein n=1 Tax=Syncephalastrum racemosum TaxID=13706 RepID=A0A1X2HTQ6_SYNRA|nr:hypothetical protein BCR43DRAFT_510054 [Syncephalastrum racemosum]